MPEDRLDALISSCDPRLLRVLEGIPGWFWETDADHRFTHFSDNWARLTGGDVNAYLGRSRLEFFEGVAAHTEGARRHLEDLKHHRPFREFVYRHEFHSGQTSWVAASGDPVLTKGGVFSGYRGVALLISPIIENAESALEAERALLARNAELERIIAERTEDVRRNNRLLADVIEGMGEGLLVYDSPEGSATGRIVLSNAQFAAMLDVDPSLTVAGADLAALQRAVLARDPAAAAAIDLRGGVEQREIMASGVGDTVLLARSAPRPSGGAILSCSDVTALIRRERELEAARMAAEAASEAKSQFLANMSHEIRTPMNGVLGMAEILASTRLDDEQAGYVATIRDSAGALMTVINDLLDFSKIEAGKMTITPAPFDIRTLLDDVLALLRGAARDKGLALAAAVDIEAPALLVGDAGRLRQILVNLVGNAVKFTDEGRIDVAVSPAHGGGVRITVSDTGVGIPTDRLEDVFAAFAQIDATAVRRHEGTGLGLAITRRLAELMGGDVTVSSVLGEGSAFTVTLPLTPGDTQDASPAAEVADWPNLTGVRVLIAEDNPVNQLVIAKYLEPLGGVLTLCDDGEKAASAYRESRQELILMDLSMPRMSGLEATRLIRAHEAAEGWSPCTILALTGAAMPEQRVACVEAGMDDFLTKPIGRDRLFQALADHVVAPTDRRSGVR